MSDPQGLAFDPVAADYDLGRPVWPRELLEGIEGNDVLDLAAGTGKLTRLLVQKYPRVVAVEPLASMRSFITDEAEVLAGTVREDGLVNWPPVDDAGELDRVQWCHGAPGMVATLGDLMPRDLLLGGAELAWLDRARRFAVHPLEQVERERAALGRGGYTLFTGDVGAALVAQSGLDVDPRFPTMDVW